LGGFIQISARDMNDAIQVASAESSLWKRPKPKGDTHAYYFYRSADRYPRGCKEEIGRKDHRGAAITERPLSSDKEYLCLGYLDEKKLTGLA
jgi:hypothetical protein